MNANYEKYKEHLQKIADIDHSTAVLSWDQEVYMPPKGLPIRAKQLATLAGISHELFINNEFGELLEELHNGNSLTPKEVRNVEESLKDYKEQKKYSVAFVEKLSRTISESFSAWKQAKEKDDYKLFAPYLEKIIQLRREECELLGYEEHPYDALLNQYEPGAKTSDLEVLFADVKEKLVGFVKRISECPQNNDAFMHHHYNKDKQWELGIYLLKQMGYDFDSGRQDISPHPFTTSFGSMDVRVTTRVAEDNLSEMVWSCIHEGGHALYEQGLGADDYGLPTGSAISLGIHESQSRLWENNVGRSLPYWKANFHKVQALFPKNLKDVTVEDFYKAMNIVRPSLVRTQSDEITYHFHILIRFELEKRLMEGDLNIMDVPSFWNAKYKEYLGIDVPSDSKGVLQDIHWAHGSFGYFPTYSLGSFYAAQFYNQAKKDILGLENHIENGNMQPLRDWLRTNIHQYGRYYSAEELCRKVTGEKINFNYFMSYVEEKYAKLYPFNSK